MARRNCRIRTRSSGHIRVLAVLRSSPRSGGGRRPKGERRGLATIPTPRGVRGKIVIRGRVGVLMVADPNCRLERGGTCMVVVCGRVIPRLAMMRVPYDAGLRALPVPRGQPLRRNVQRTCGPAVARHARR